MRLLPLVLLAMLRGPSGLWVPEHGIVQARGFNGAMLAAAGNRHRSPATVAAAPSAGTWPNEPSNYRAANGGTTLLDENMSTLWQGQNAKATLETSTRGGGSMNRANWAAGVQGGGDGSIWGGLNHDFTWTAAQDVFFGCWMRFSAAFEFHPAATKVGPWLGVQGEGVTNATLVVGAHDNQSEHGPHTVIITQQGNLSDIASEVFFSDACTPNSFLCGGGWSLDEWLQVEILLHGNDSGSANGTLAMWINNVAVISNRTGLTFRSGAVGRFTGARIDPYWGGSDGSSMVHSNYIDYDHYYASRP